LESPIGWLEATSAAIPKSISSLSIKSISKTIICAFIKVIRHHWLEATFIHATIQGAIALLTYTTIYKI